MVKHYPFRDIQFHPVVKLPEDYRVFDFTKGYDPEEIQNVQWGIGRYNERRHNMYTAPQYANRRYIHMGIDIWTPPGEPVYASRVGLIAYMADHDQPGNYGPTIVLNHQIGKSDLFALYGHLTRDSLTENSIGDIVHQGSIFAKIGSSEENGGWMPHLHYQLSWNDPGEADMPGVVAESELEEALQVYPDPRIVLGNLY